MKYKYQIKEKRGMPSIDDKLCTYQNPQIRKEILEFFEFNREFNLPKKYKVEETGLGFAKICLAVDPYEDKALTLMQLLENATGATFEDYDRALSCIVEYSKKL